AGNFVGSASSTADDIKGTVAGASSFNLIGTGGSGGLTGANNNQILVANPRLAALGGYGGATPTVALLPGRPALDPGRHVAALTTDQRGNPRTVDLASLTNPGDGTDIGAFESGGFTVAIIGGDNQQTAPSTAFAGQLGVSVTPVNSGEPFIGGVVTFNGP